jgi:RHS repeat-associated protein
VVTFSVWDDWELVEEYGTGNVVKAKYLQGAHGPVKSLLNPVYYYYQDSLGSTSHVADASGQLVEFYKYNLYGKPTVWRGTSQVFTDPVVSDLFSGERWIPQLNLYDLRNRYYSPDLGRFLQPDPIGFKGDASNLYRYCGNDWANKTDPTGLLTGASPALDASKDTYDAGYIGGAGSGQFDKMQNMGAIQVGRAENAHSVEMRAASTAEGGTVTTGQGGPSHGAAWTGVNTHPLSTPHSCL